MFDSRFTPTILAIGACVLIASIGGCATNPLAGTGSDWRPIFALGRDPTRRECAITSTTLETLRIRNEVACCNLANVGTPGYKARRAVQATTLTSGGDTSGPTIAGIVLDMMAGAPERGGTLDVYLNGSGFLQVESEDGGLAYTRDGRLSLDPRGRIATLVGARPLVPDITIPSDAIRLDITESGEVYAQTPGTPEPSLIGQIELADFIVPERLRPGPGSMLLATDSCGQSRTGVPGRDGFGTLTQGTYEGSNVDPTRERIALINVERERSLWETPAIRSQVSAVDH